MKMTPEQKTVIFLLFSIFYFLFSLPSFAAEINVIPLNWEVSVGHPLQINVSLSTGGESINAISGEVWFPQDMLELEEIKDGNSIINLWVEKPRKEENKIVFAGIIPGGFGGENGLLFSLVFKTKGEGNGVIELRHMESFLNDGKGTPAPLKLFQLAFAVRKEGIITQLPPPGDSQPPESFLPEIARDTSLFDDKWFLVFATQDKGAGIDHYEVREARYKFLAPFYRWRVAESPYVLQDQALRSYIYVKAVDKAGNTRLAQVPPRHPLVWYKSRFNWFIIVLLLASVFFLWQWRQKRNR